LRHHLCRWVLGTDMGDKIFFDKYPGLAWLCSWDVPELGLQAQPFGVAMQESGGLRKVECSHFSLPVGPEKGPPQGFANGMLFLLARTTFSSR